MTTKLIPILLLAFFVAPQIGAQDVPQEVIQAAEEGLPTFLSNLTPSRMEDYGFSENDNLDDAVLGRPFRFYNIANTKVEEYRRGDTIYDVLDLLTEALSWDFPVMIEDETKCVLGVAKMRDGWEAVYFGMAMRAQRVALVRKVWPTSEGYNPLFCSSKAVMLESFFSIPEVDEYNLTQLYWPQIESEDELTQLYEDLRPLSEAMKYITSEIPDGNDGWGGSGGNDYGYGGGNGIDTGRGCFISSAM